MDLPFEGNPHKSFIKGYNTLGFLSVDTVLPLIKTNKERHTFTVETRDVNIKLSSIRLLPFIKSLKCYNPYCNEVGHVFAVQQSTRGVSKNEYSGWHINLYSKTGKLMTCDHLIPKSTFPKGVSPNSAENLDTLCCVCNTKKGRMSVEEFLEAQKYASLFYTRKSQLKEHSNNPIDFEGMTVGDAIKILKKLPPTMRLAVQKPCKSGYGMPINLVVEVKKYSKWDQIAEPEQLRAFISYNEV